MRSAGPVGSILVALVAIASAACSSNGHPTQVSEANRLTCAAVQDYSDDTQAKADLPKLQTDLDRAGQAANRGADAELARRARAAKIAVGKYAAELNDPGHQADLNMKGLTNADDWKPAATAVIDLGNQCTAVGSPIHR